MQKILLINPPLYFSAGSPMAIDSSVPPLGLLYLASYINNYSIQFRAEIIDVKQERLDLPTILEKINSLNPFAIGITGMTAQLQGATELAIYIRTKSNKKIPIFFGGPHISADTDFIHRNPGIFDYVITGEAEKTFLDSLNKLEAGENIPQIQQGEVIKDLDLIPFPDYNLIADKKYVTTHFLLFSRGCPYKCYYCSRPSISKLVRYYSVRSLVEEIKKNYAYSNGVIDFQDDTFTINKQNVLGLCNEIIKENLNVRWMCNTRIDLVDENLLRLMKKAGCYHINFGIESGNERVRKEIICKGNFTNQQIQEVIRLCKKYHIEIAGYFMIGHPTETKEDIQDTKKMILSYGFDVLGLSLPLPFPGSRLYEIAKQEHIITEETIDNFSRKKLGEGYSGIYPVYIPPGLNYDHIMKTMQEINRRFYLNPRVLWKFKGDLLSIKKLMRGLNDLLCIITKGTTSRKPYIKQNMGVPK